MAKDVVEIDESKIRVVIWMLKAGKTKKACCEELGINYNTKRLDSIVADFHAREARKKELKKLARQKTLSDAEKKDIVSEYNKGTSIAAIAERYFLTAPRIKAILIEKNVPLRGKGKNKSHVDHIKQDLEVKFKKGDKAFHKVYSAPCTIMEVFDEDYIEMLQQGRQRFIRLPNISREEKIKAGKPVQDERPGIDYEIYWVLPNGLEYKLNAVEGLIKSINTHIEETGREYYRVWIERPDDQFFAQCSRDRLYPISTD
jgi:hypothetical protein